MTILGISILLIFFATTPNLGFFTIPSILTVTSVILILILNTSSLIKIKSFDIKSEKVLTIYLFFILLFYSAIYYGGLYQNKNSIVLGYFVLTGFILINFIRYHFFKKTFSFIFICTVYVLMSLWTIFNSPHPVVDTVVVLKEAPQMLIRGKNPYSSTFTQVYPNVNPNYYNYLPFSFFYELPFVLLFKDPRSVIVFSNLLSAILIYKLFKKTDKERVINVFVLTFLFLPRTFYMLEHAYLDPVIFSFFLLFIFFYVNKNKNKFAYLFLGLFLSFKQPPILTIPLFLKENFFRKDFFKLKNFSLFLLPLILPLIYLAINSKAFLEDIVFGLNPAKITSPISSSLTLPTLLKYLSINANFAYLIGLILFAVTFIYLFFKKTSPLTKIVITFLAFNYFTYHAFFNSYFLVIQFLLLAITTEYFGQADKAHSKKSLQLFHLGS